ncbi:MAG: hypothetical protein LBL62_08490 [Planctomycetaceae bacterium]|jgi:hypothetical protein|nr:hypothetical protein [Planctomycetaceae bacterium]
MALNWNEIKTRASVFVNEWRDKVSVAREKSDAQTFENEFFYLFGVSRSQMAIFEHKVNLLDGSGGFIDLFWKGHILIEMKSPGENMQKAYEQAKNYANALPPSELPKGILICDFVRFHYYNLLEGGKLYEFQLDELVDHVSLFSDLAGYKEIEYKKQDAVNLEAAEKLGKFHDRLREIGYNGHQLEVYLVRILFCLFADDTGIFEPDFFVNYILRHTNPDGNDLALHIQKIFETLSKPVSQRLKTIDEQLNQFPYVDGDLFEERLETADFDSKMRETLIDCCRLDWSKISPAIFGAMFQSVMNEEERHHFGAHYTSEENILKLIHPLFLDSLWEEFDKLQKLKPAVRKTRLKEFHNKLSQLKFLDPACGCGNFLVISYRELRILELEVLKELLKGEKLLDIDHYIKVNVDQFYGIEIVEFPSKIAQVAMWLMDHQMNTLVRNRFGRYFVRIPLSVSASIHFANAFEVNWENIVSKKELSYILGNPPFLGARVMNSQQKYELEREFCKMKNYGNLDYVTAWYKKAAVFIQGTNIDVAFVSTNSICQGEQVAILWRELMNKHNIKINFAHQTFKWSNEAKGNAAVYCVIVGFGLQERKEKRLFQYDDICGKAKERIVKRINGYLVNAENIFIESRTKPLCNVPEIGVGNKPIDGGYYLFTKQEKKDFIKEEPAAAQWFRTWIGSDEFINGYCRYCLWLGDCTPVELRKMPKVMKRVEAVRKYRLASTSIPTQKIALTPTRFHIENMPKKNSLIIPKVSTSKRQYIPMGFITSKMLASDLVFLIPGATLYHFGVLTSAIHMAWMRYVCGRLGTGYRYSASIVYNNFPFPNPTDKQKHSIETAAQAILDIRANFLNNTNSNLAGLYDPLSMPSELAKAHQKLDKLVDKTYGRIFTGDSERVAFLFERYQKITGALLTKTKKGK